MKMIFRSLLLPFAFLLFIFAAPPARGATIDWFTSFDYSTSPSSYFNAVVGSPTIQASDGRRSTFSLRGLLNSAAGGNKTLPTARTTLAVGFAFKTAQLPSTSSVRFFEFGNSGTVHVVLCLDTAGHIVVARGTCATVLATSSNAISAPNFYHIETKVTIDDATGAVETKVNETSSGWIAATSLDTRNGSSTTVNEIAFGSGSNGGGPQSYDDVIVATDFIGDKTIKARFCTGDGNYSQWTRSGGATNCSVVDETTPNDDTDYVATGTVNNIDTYTFSTPAAGETVTAVAVNFRVKKTDAGTASVAPLIRASSTDHVGTDFNPSDSSYLYNQQIYQTNPQGGAAWSDSNWAEFGIKRTN